MDFLSLSRRELQALCKKNKVPANITNVAMIESLKALEMVEGIDELMSDCQSGTAQSSVESQDMTDVSSPFVPPTVGRSARRTNIPKGTLDSVNPATRTRRTTQKTPAPLMPESNRKTGQMASARLNIDSQLKDCEDEDKTNALRTPAVPNRRKKVEGSTVKIMCSTRRSARLAEKSNMKMSNAVENNFNELSATTDVDAMSMVDVKFENKDETEVVSGETSVVRDEFEAVSDEKRDIIEEEEECTNFKSEVKVEEEKCDNEEDMPLCITNEVPQNYDVEKSTEELKPEEDEASQDEASDIVEDVILETGVNTGFLEEIKEESADGSMESYVDFSEQNPNSGTVFSDNKENIESGGKLVIMRDVKMSKDLDELSVRKLTKMLKKKLEITKKSSKNDMLRPVLEAVSENLLVG